jgi:glycosyltransferase involved in cell wall biosynthesis
LSRLGVAFDATPLLGEPTGVGTFCSGALSGLSRREDVSVSAFAVSWRRRHGIKRALPAGVRAVERPLPARPVHVLWRHSGIPPIEWVSGPVGVVHGSNFIVPPARRAARIVTVHDLTTVRFPELCDGPTLRFPALVRRAVGEGAFVHTPSRFVASEVVEHFGAQPDRVVAVPHGVSFIGASPGAMPSSVPEGPYLLAIGTIEPRKDLPTLVRAFAALAAGFPELRLVVAGGRGWGSDAFDAAVAGSGVADRVLALGYVPAADCLALLGKAEVFCYPSIYEGFGLPPLDAMAAGVPVVSTTAGAIPEVAGSAAVLVPPRDDGALASAIETVLTDSALRARLVAAGGERAAAFTWEACAAGLVSLYQEAVAAR